MEPVTDQVEGLSKRIGLFATHILLAFGTCMLFCNQTVGTVLSVVGGPFFLWLLVRQRGGRTHD